MGGRRGGVASALVGWWIASCSTLADPVEDGPPVCKFCDVGEQELHCEIVTLLDGAFNSGISDSAYVCLDPMATDEEKEQACIDSCEQYIAGNMIGLECAFKEDGEPFEWSACVPPTEPTGGVGGGAGHECPGWYAPRARTSGYEEGAAGAMVTVERALLDDIRADPFTLYACDDARYVEHDDGWVFEGLDPWDLLFELGLREGDRNAVVQGFEPISMEVETKAFALDSIERMQAAYEALAEASGVRVAVERAGVDGGVWVVWVVIE